ncbi:transcription termination factor Rho [Modestobacter italicus]|uniref:transcription termination factor Rho n=1 Tax=Modestobacter italicus (strain DSM 44449 / CECT 9708 / BC 501) TaxID=2732864 RepID=UPI001C977116|nr:transcription termination factor Rho [Modestobacter italicus]
MSETTDLIDGAPDAAPSDEAAAGSGTAPRSRRRGSGLSGMLLPELQRLAAELGIPGTGKMRKSDLVAAISERQVRGDAGSAPAATAPAPRTEDAGTGGVATSAAPLEAPISGGGNGGPITASPAPRSDETPTDGATTGRRRRGASRPAGAPTAEAPAAERTATDDAPAVETTAGTESPATAGEGERPQRSRRERGDRAPRDGGDREDRTSRDGSARDGSARDAEERGGRNRADGEARNRAEGEGRNRAEGEGRNRAEGEGRNRADGEGRNRAEGEGRNGRNRNDGARDGNRSDGGRDGNRNDGGAARNDTRNDARNDEDDDDFEGGGRGRRGRRYRDRNRRGGNAAGGRERFDQGEPTVSEDDVLLPVAGILDVLDSYAFVRTSGYLTGPNDVYVSLSQVRRYGLRRGDAITGAVRQPREGERKDKYNALVRLDSVNGLDPEQARNRPEFTKLTPLYPQDRLRLETESHLMTTRLIDLVMPIGKGQRALIVSPPKAGKTMVLQSIANAITTNNPEVHLMVVLVDERPEEVTDMQRSVKGEVIASTFDRPPADHTTVAELSIERAKRLVEMGHDVVVLLDSITRLGRAYNLAAPASGRILSGGVDSTALYPPKRFLGAARNIENGGSLTIIASALVETGSTMDTVIFEEFKGTGNAEIKLDRRLADKRVFPAVDVNASGTRKEEILLSPDELAIVIKLRRVMSALEPQQALELLLDRMRKTRNNIEFLMQVQKTTLGVNEKD